MCLNGNVGFDFAVFFFFKERKNYGPQCNPIGLLYLFAVGLVRSGFNVSTIRRTALCS